MFQFSCRFAFYQFFIKPDTDNNENFDTVSNKRGNFDAIQYRRHNFDKISVWM